MAVDMFLKLEGIKGESVDSKHADEIDVLGYSWGVEQTSSAHYGAGGGAGKAHFKDVSIDKRVDSATPNLMLFCASGKHIAKGLLTVRKAGETPLEYLKIKLTDLIITSSASNGHANDMPMETVTLSAAKVEFEYTPQKKDGSGGAAVSMGWDVAKNVKV